ncbi:hypothetical protein AVEN_128180-1 [Araneus ventricosus]|uniref:Uncharacterized protein n=1 Tax=Araneus ventricosus TaxID=182803 RepID=A0A4Y1ZZV7_ARAVE|nr:hypothetical protein AVEN_128180-1 [Araneus ventricosus]
MTVGRECANQLARPRDSRPQRVKELRNRKHLQRGPISPPALWNIMEKYERTKPFYFLLGTGGKRVESVCMGDVATAVVESSSHSSDGSHLHQQLGTTPKVDTVKVLQMIIKQSADKALAEGNDIPDVDALFTVLRER